MAIVAASFSPIRAAGRVKSVDDVAKLLDRVQDQLASQLNPALAQLAALKLKNASPILFGAQSTPASTSAVYLRPIYGQLAADSNELFWVVQQAGTVSGLVVQAFSGPTLAAVTFVLRRKSTADQVAGRAASNTSVSAVIQAGATQGSDSSHSLTVAAGDMLSISATGGAGITVGTSEPRAFLLMVPN